MDPASVLHNTACSPWHLDKQGPMDAAKETHLLVPLGKLIQGRKTSGPGAGIVHGLCTWRKLAHWAHPCTGAISVPFVAQQNIRYRPTKVLVEFYYHYAQISFNELSASLFEKYLKRI